MLTREGELVDGVENVGATGVGRRLPERATDEAQAKRLEQRGSPSDERLSPEMSKVLHHVRDTSRLFVELTPGNTMDERVPRMTGTIFVAIASHQAVQQ